MRLSKHELGNLNCPECFMLGTMFCVCGSNLAHNEYEEEKVFDSLSHTIRKINGEVWLCEICGSNW